MSQSPFIRYVIPSVLLGAVAGYVGAIAFAPPSSGGKEEKLSPRAAFLSSEDDAVDYDKLARVCLAASERTTSSAARSPRSAAPSGPAVERAKDELDLVMSRSLETGVWSRGAAFRADNYLRQLPASDVADFGRLLETAVQRGDLTLQDGAWLPGEAK